MNKKMKYSIISIISAVALLFGVAACQQPEEFHPNVQRNAIENLTASFLDDDRDENKFTSEIDHVNRVITVVFPYNYPRLSDKVLEYSDLTKMKVIADLDNNAYITPPILYMDLSKENYIKVTDQEGNVFDYKVVAEIRKSAECAVTKFNIPDFGLSGIIKEGEKSISLLTFEEIKGVLADVTLSHGATISPDPTKTRMDYIDPVKFTVTAQNGVDKAEYTVKRDTPQKIASGLRSGSAKILWTKKMTDLGYTTLHMHTGIGITGDYIVINERANGNAQYLDYRTGEVAGNIDISSIAGSLTNYYMTSDNAGNLFICNLLTAASQEAPGTFTIYRIKGVKGTPEKFIEMNNVTCPVGRKFSVIGDVDKDAIITAPWNNTAGQFARWQIKDGAFVSTTPDLVVISGIGDWRTNADIVYSDPTDITSDYFAAYYAEPRNHVIIDGKTNTIKAKDVGPESGGIYSGNWIMNAVDYTAFNKGKYAIYNTVNSFNWGKDDKLYLFDVGAGNLETQVADFSDAGLAIDGNYGGWALGVQNTNGTADVKLHVSEDGFYMYVFFMFTNGYIGCVQCDCIDM